MENEVEVKPQDELLDSQQPEAEALDALDYDSLLAKAKATEEKNKQLFARLKKTEAKQVVKVEEPKPKLNLDDEIVKRLTTLEVEREKHKFGYKHKLSPEEVDKIYAFSSTNPEEALVDPFIKAGLDAIRKEQRVKDATPSSSRSATTVGNKSWAEMSEDERAKNYSKIMSGGK